MRIFILITYLFCLGCANLEKSTALGAGIGGVTGASIGAIASDQGNSMKRHRNIALGSVLGVATGAILGHHGHKYIEKREKRSRGPRPLVVNQNSTKRATNRSPVKLRPAKIRVRFVDDQIEGKTKIPAHFEYDILEEAKWE